MCLIITCNPKTAFSQSHLTIGLTAFAILAMCKEHQYDQFFTRNVYIKFDNSNMRYYKDTPESLSWEIQLFKNGGSNIIIFH